jgi:hypothetical protein
VIRPSAPGERRILVIAGGPSAGRRRSDSPPRAEGVEDRRVVCPALMSPVRYFASDEDGPRAAAQERLERSLERLRELGVTAEGEVGDADPLQAIEDGLRTFGADEVIISTHPEGRSVWLEGVACAARERTTSNPHVVVDPSQPNARKSSGNRRGTGQPVPPQRLSGTGSAASGRARRRTGVGF